jgi:hypothetical protein
MIDNPISLSESYVLINKILNTLIRRKFGKHYFIRLNSLLFIANRTNRNYFQTCSEKITLKSLKPVSLNEMIIIKEFLILNINSALFCIDYSSYKEVVNIDIIIP